MKQMNRWVRWTALDLLDDNLRKQPDIAAWQDLNKVAPKAVATVPKAQTTKAAASQPKKQKAPAGKVFSSSPTLREMMRDYNRNNSSLGPIKSYSTPSNDKPQRRDFRYDSVEVIEIPTIPGKILRPC